jgi:hypothetical protein
VPVATDILDKRAAASFVYPATSVKWVKSFSNSPLNVVAVPNSLLTAIKDFCKADVVI